MNEHLSSFALDVWFADAKPDGEVALHVASCARCCVYLKGLDALSAAEVSLPSPPAEAFTRREAAPVRSPLRLVTRVATVLALAASVVLFVRSRAPVLSPDYVGVKGAPAVQLLVRSSGSTRVWDGRSPIRAGDSIAIHVACESLAHVAVAAETSSGISRLLEVPCPNAPSALPFTLVVDDQPGHERFAVVLTKAPVDDVRLRELVRTNARDRDDWVTAFDFTKGPRR